MVELSEFHGENAAKWPQRVASPGTIVPFIGERGRARVFGLAFCPVVGGIGSDPRMSSSRVLATEQHLGESARTIVPRLNTSGTFRLLQRKADGAMSKGGHELGASFVAHAQEHAKLGQGTDSDEFEPG